MAARITKKAKKTAAVHAAYAARTGMDKRSAKILVAAHIVKLETFEDDQGNVVRVWKSAEMSSYSNADIASTLRNRVAVEPNEMLGTVPPSAIKYCVTKGWLVPNACKTLYSVTLRGAVDLNLPLRFKGGAFHGRKIPFAATPSASTKG
jgi:hypothetical protein